MLEERLVILLVKLAVAASLASILVRSTKFKRMLLREERTFTQRIQMALGFASIFGAGVATRVMTHLYTSVDLGLEGSLLSGILGGYVTGLVSGILISVPAMLNGEFLTDTINRAIEHSFSPQGIRWRIESWRTGVPFAQIVMRHALVYRVEQVLLVHAETGLLLAHVPDGALGDADLVSSMLTAIGDLTTRVGPTASAS